MIDEHVDFTERLQVYLDLEGISYVSLARRSHIEESTMRGYYNGKTKPNLDNIRKIANGSGVSADYWVGVTKELRRVG